MLPEILQGLALGHVIGILIEITEPELAILPINVPKTFHAGKLHPRPNPGNEFVLAERPRSGTTGF
jgi:hypothetical protein